MREKTENKGAARPYPSCTWRSLARPPEESAAIEMLFTTPSKSRLAEATGKDATHSSLRTDTPVPSLLRRVSLGFVHGPPWRGASAIADARQNVPQVVDARA